MSREGQDVVNTTRKKTFKQKKITEFLKEYSDNNLLLNDERIKLCSSDDFNELSASFKDLLKQKSAPTMISQVGGFYVMASLAGFSASHSKTKPTLFFFDRKRNNIVRY